MALKETHWFWKVAAFATPGRYWMAQQMYSVWASGLGGKDYAVYESATSSELMMLLCIPGSLLSSLLLIYHLDFVA